jgi:sterol desaturase/sphingolipid hydroxylase (fatty acid hydroxylase superfamily)
MSALGGLLIRQRQQQMHSDQDLSDEENPYISFIKEYFVVLLTGLFISLKLAGIINWSWWWVISPMLISVALGLGIILFVLTAFYGMIIMGTVIILYQRIRNNK